MNYAIICGMMRIPSSPFQLVFALHEEDSRRAWTIDVWNRYHHRVLRADDPREIRAQIYAHILRSVNYIRHEEQQSASKYVAIVSPNVRFEPCFQIECGFRHVLMCGFRSTVDARSTLSISSIIYIPANFVWSLVLLCWRAAESRFPRAPSVFSSASSSVSQSVFPDSM